MFIVEEFCSWIFIVLTCIGRLLWTFAAPQCIVWTPSIVQRVVRRAGGYNHSAGSWKSPWVYCSSSIGAVPTRALRSAGGPCRCTQDRWGRGQGRECMAVSGSPCARAGCPSCFSQRKPQRACQKSSARVWTNEPKSLIACKRNLLLFSF